MNTVKEGVVVYAQSWTDLLAQIRQRPAMYLGSANLKALDMFIGGFTMAEVVYAVSEQRRKEFNDFPWDAFETYVSDLYNKSRLSLRSFGLAQYEAQGETIETFDASKEYPDAWEIWWQWHDKFWKK
jgi:hypothetical protein